MGIYLNPGKRSFEEALNSSIYVDKTELLRFLNTLINTKQKYVSVSRPRRFGKTMTADMLCAYYDRTAGSRSLFEGRKLSQCDNWDSFLGKFNVLHVVMTEFIKINLPVATTLKRLEKRILDDLHEAYPETAYDPDDFPYSMECFYRKSGIPFVIIIDEWDAVFRIRKSDKEGQALYLNFLRDWLKDKEYAALAYMTGILPIKKYGEHSALNMFTEYSMISPKDLASYTGFTSGEVREICDDRKLNYEALKSWYDGYRLSDKPSEELTGIKVSSQYHVYEIYSPLSVVNAVTYEKLENYWNNSESYEALAEYIRRDFDGLKDTVALLMDGGRTKVDLSTYQNDMTTFHSRDDILALLIHLGYLGYDSDTGEVFIPNKEILDVFKSSTKTEEWQGTFRQYETSQQLLEATLACDEEKVAELLEEAHDKASNKTYNDEAALSYGIQYAYYAAEKYYTKALELDSGKGYADIAYLPSPKYPDKPAMVIELKYNQDTETAMDQIRKRNYPGRLGHYKNNILLVSINYDKDLSSKNPQYKHHTCHIERA